MVVVCIPAANRVIAVWLLLLPLVTSRICIVTTDIVAVLSGVAFVCLTWSPSLLLVCIRVGLLLRLRLYLWLLLLGLRLLCVLSLRTN